jgi:VanZ family protein
MTRAEKREAVGQETAERRRASFAWRYGPLLLWMAFIFFASTAQLSASNTSRIIRPLLLWLYPGISEERLAFAHFIVRKLGHLTEYAVLALLAARAFVSSSPLLMRRRRWFLFSLLLVIAYALSDEFHQSFVPERTGTIYDSFIDMAGGFIALLVLLIWRKGRKEN